MLLSHWLFYQLPYSRCIRRNYYMCTLMSPLLRMVIDMQVKRLATYTSDKELKLIFELPIGTAVSIG